MRIGNDIPLRAKTSFLSVEKDMETIVTEIFKNERIKKLLYHTRKEALSMPELTDEQTASLFTNNVKIVPKITVDKDVLNYIIVSFDNFTGNATNPEFRDNIISFDIVCHFDQWHLGNFKLRPYRIAAELDGMLNGKHLSGIGTLEFLGCNQIILNDEFGGLSLMFLAIHGEDDKVPHPDTPKMMREEFEELYKN
jgi:hypothetical protein